MSDLDQFQQFGALKISLASPEKIRSWSHGEVLEPETINYRTFRAEKDGLFCEKIFGPTKDFECYCGKYKKIRFKGVICDKCGVEVTRRRVRRERMGHIELASPCAHVWFFGTVPSKMARLLGMRSKDLKAVVYFSRYVFLDVDEEKKQEVIDSLDDELRKEKKELKNQIDEEIKEIEKRMRKESEAAEDEKEKEKILLEGRKEIANLRDSLVTKQDNVEKKYDILSEHLKEIHKMSTIGDAQYRSLEKHLNKFSEVGIGAPGVKKVLEDLDTEAILKRLKKRLRETDSKSKAKKLIRRLKVLEEFNRSEVAPSWMILDVLPVIPPELRPMVQLEGGRFATSDLNDLYRAVINRNNRLKELLELGAPELILKNERRMLQEAVDALIDSSRSRRRRYWSRKKLRSLSDLIKGKQGRFRRNLLGKRVDYSGRSVIVVGPDLKVDECGLPKELALELFKPMVIREVLMEGLAPNIKLAKEVVKQQPPEIWDLLERVVKDWPVLLNRAPTLHRLGILAFYPKLLEGKAISLHPCVCAGYNADFDGDQMAVHVPLSRESRDEAEEVMLSTENLLKPASGSPVVTPSKDMVLGLYWLTLVEGSEEDKVYSESEAVKAWENGVLGLRELANIEFEGALRETTLGRIFLNRVLPPELRYVNEVVGKSVVKDLLARALEECGEDEMVNLVDDLKELGFEYATISGISMGIFDTDVSVDKESYIREAESKIAEIEKNYRRGLLTEQEMTRLSQEVWMDLTGELEELTWESLDTENPMRILIESGARGSQDQVKQLSGMKGLVVDPTGKVVELPTKSNYFEGLSEFEYYVGTRGSRKGLTDTALRTADAGYLTRRLVDVCQEVLVREKDCGTEEGIEISRDDGEEFAPFGERIVGRVAADTIKDEDGNILARRNDVIDLEKAREIDANGPDTILVRSPMTCSTPYGICQKCYGWDLGWRKMVELGSPVGVIGAQSIGEPGTQLTLHGKQAGKGVVGAMEITQGLPRVDQIFEVRTPKALSPMSRIAGKVSLSEQGEGTLVTVTSQDEDEEEEYFVPPALNVLVSEGDLVGRGTQLASGHLDPEKILKLQGLRAVQRYLLSEVQKVYSSQGVELNDKHVEVVLRQMASQVKIISSGDTPFMPGEVVSKERLEVAHSKLGKSGGKAEAQQLILGITKVSLKTDSWLSAASFQSTRRVLTDSAVEGAIDHLRGLKENVMVGKKIPVEPEMYVED